MRPMDLASACAGEDMLIASMGVMARGSTAMFARRRRILDEARKMMAEGGAEAMAMRDLAERSGVSLRTLYNAFGSKEALIAAAVRQYYDKFLRALSVGRDLDDFDWVLTGVVATNLRNQQIRAYLSSVVGLYFSQSADPVIRSELRRMGAGFMTGWMEQACARRQLRRGTDVARAIGRIASLQYAVNQEWLSGHASDAEFMPAILEGVLTYLAGMARGAALARIEALLTDLQGPRELIGRLVAGEERRVTGILDGSGGFRALVGEEAGMAAEQAVQV